MKKIAFLILIAIGAGLFISRTVGRRDIEEESAAPEADTLLTTDKAGATSPADHEDPVVDQRIESRTPDREESASDYQAARPAARRVESGEFGADAFSFVLPDREQKQKGSYREHYRKAEQLNEAGKLVEARRILTEAYLAGEPEVRKQARELLDEISKKLVFDPRYTRAATTHTVQRGETLSSIAARYGVNWRMLQRINRIARPELIRLNQQIKVIEGQPRILVDKNSFTLTLFIDDYYVREYPVGLGRDDKTPVGVFTVDSLLIEADWYPPTGGVIKYGEEGHLIGTRWIGFEDRPGAAGYGIHGTNDPGSIGAMESEGCVRMQNEDVEELYDFLVTGTQVKIIE